MCVASCECRVLPACLLALHPYLTGVLKQGHTPWNPFWLHLSTALQFCWVLRHHAGGQRGEPNSTASPPASWPSLTADTTSSREWLPIIHLQSCDSLLQLLSLNLCCRKLMLQCCNPCYRTAGDGCTCAAATSTTGPAAAWPPANCCANSRAHLRG
jgi:hypothetical protein